MNDTFLQVSNWAAQKQADLRQTWIYYPLASTHMVNTQLLRVQNVHTKYRKYFRGFWIRAWIRVYSMYINTCRIFEMKWPMGKQLLFWKTCNIWNMCTVLYLKTEKYNWNLLMHLVFGNILFKWNYDNSNLTNKLLQLGNTWIALFWMTKIPEF